MQGKKIQEIQLICKYKFQMNNNQKEVIMVSILETIIQEKIMFHINCSDKLEISYNYRSYIMNNFPKF